MKNIYKKYNFLEQHEIDYLNELCKNFVVNEFQIYDMHYINSDELLDYKNKINEYVTSTYGKRYVMMMPWINKVTPTSVDSDSFHFDESVLSFVTYFNLDFEGGEFEYHDENSNKIVITPQINLSLVMNDRLWHRIRKVTSGERYSLVTFFKLTSEYDKKEKSIL